LKTFESQFSASLRNACPHLALHHPRHLTSQKYSQELRAILPDTVVPVQPLLNGTRRLYNMFPDFKQYPYVLPGFHYKGLADLQATLEEKIIKPAEEKQRNWNGSRNNVQDDITCIASTHHIFDGVDRTTFSFRVHHLYERPAR